MRKKKKERGPTAKTAVIRENSKKNDDAKRQYLQVRCEVKDDCKQRGEKSVHFAELNAAVAVRVKDREGDCDEESANKSNKVVVDWCVEAEGKKGREKITT